MTTDTRLPAVLTWASFGLIAVAVLGQALPTVVAAPANYFTVTPCRVFDSRQPADGPALPSGVTRTVTVAGARGCGVPSNAGAVFLNVTAIGATALGHLRLSEQGIAPATSVLNFPASRTRANNVTVRLSASGQVDAMPVMADPAATMHLAIDVYGYFVDDLPPVAVDDALSVGEDGPATTFDVLGNDSNPDGGSIQIDTVTQPANGVVVIGTGGANLTYEPDANYCNTPPGTALDTFTYTLVPGGSTATVSVTVNCVDDAPLLAGAGTVIFTEHAGPVPVGPALTVLDIDDTNLESGTVTITNLLDTGVEVLAADTTGTAIVAVYAAPTLTLTGTDTLANYQLVLRRVTYNNTAGSPNATQRSVTFVVNDGALPSNTATATVTLTPANDAPVLTAGGASPTFTEDGPAVAVDPALAATDVDDTDLESATVSITNLIDTGAEALAANTGGTAIVATYLAPNLTLTGTDTVAHYQQVLRGVTYANSSQNPSATARSITFVASDGTDSSNTVTKTLVVVPVNDAPVLTAGGGSPTFTEDGPPVVVDPGLLATDVDDTNLESATVTITNPQDGPARTANTPAGGSSELLAANTAGTSIVASYTAPTLTLTGTDTVANYRQVLRTVTYINTSESPTPVPRIVAFQGNDGTAGSNTVTTSVTILPVDDAPVLTAGGGSPTFVEGSPAVIVDPGLTLADVDSPSLTSATVTIANLQNAGAEILGATTTGTSIVASYTAPTIALTGTDTLANYRAVLRSVTYLNTSQAPSPTPRTIAFRANDGTANSNIVATTLSVTPVNDPPTLTPSGVTATYTENGPPVTVDGALAAADVDSTTFASATVTITNLLDGGQELLGASTAGTSIVAGYAAPTLTLTGVDSVANYQAVLRTVTYQDSSDAPSTTARMVAFVANDGGSGSNSASVTVNVVAVNDAPVLTAGGGSPTFVEGSPAVIVDPGLTLADVDSPSLTSATVTIANLQNAGAEILGATTTGTSIVASYTAPTIALTGTDTLANYRAVLRSVTYLNTSQAPSPTPRTIAFRANDGTANSNIVATTLSVTPVNDPPTLTPSGVTATYTENGPPVTVDGALAAADVDSTTFASATVTITNLLDGGQELLGASTAGTSIVAGYAAPTLTLTGVDSVANYQAVLRTVTYQDSSDAPSTTARMVAFVANDGGSGSNSASVAVNVVAVNDAPVLTAGGGSPTFPEDGPAVTVDPGLTVTDVDSAALASATVTIANLQNAGAEILGATTTGTSIVANYVAPMLSLTGTDTLANYRAVLRSVTYLNTSQSPGSTPRNVRFRVSDATALSNLVTTVVNVVAVNDAPVLAGAGTVTFTEDAGAVLVAPALTALDVDSPNLATATVTITNLLNLGSEILTANTTGTAITAGYVAPILTLSGGDTVAHYQQVLRTVAYNNLSQNPSSTTRSLTLVANDGVASGNTAMASVQVVPVNDTLILTTNPITYATAGNTQLHVAGATLAGVAAIADPLSALAKSAPTDVDGPAAPAVVADAGTTGNGGTFSIDASGAFTYVPAAGFTGTDSFTYQVTDSVATVTGTINVTVSSVVWYVRDVVDANNPAGGDGRSTNAFETLSAAQAASGPDHVIFVFAGNTDATPLDGIVLKDGQKLHGEGVGLSVPGFADIVAAGASPHVQNPGGDAVSIPATAGNRAGVEVRGLDLAGSGNAVDVTATGANVVEVTISDNVISGAGAEGIDLNAGSTGTFIANVQGNTITAAGNGFDARRTVAGALQIDFGRNTVVSNATAVFVDGSGVGTTLITGFADNTVSGNTGGTGISVTNAVFDSTPGGPPFDPVSGGSTAVGVSGNGVGGAGVVLIGVTGDLAFTDLDVFADGGAALLLIGNGGFNGALGTQLTVTPGAGTLRAVGGPAASIINATVDLRLGGLTSANSPGSGVSLLNVADGTVVARFSAPAGSSITGAAGTAFNVLLGNAGISYAGSITSTAGRSVSVASWNGDDFSDDLDFSGPIDDTGAGVSITGNAGSRAIVFSGTLTLTPAPGNEGLNAAGNTNTGGLRITGAANTISTSNAAALNVTDTVIGTGGLIFRSLSASGGASGIVLTNTGGTGGLTVTGTGALPTGGTIQDMSGDGISLNGTRNISLSDMNLTNNLGSGVFGDDVTDFSIIGSNVTGNADTATGAEAGLRFNELLGACAITSTTISGSSEDNVRITPNSGTLTNLAISNSTIGPNSASTGGNGVTLLGTGSAIATLTVTGTTFAGNRGAGILSSFQGTGSHTVNISSSTFRDNGKGVSLGSGSAADLTFNVVDNLEIVRSKSNALELVTSDDATSAMQIRGTFGGNVIGDANVDSGSAEGNGIAIDLRGDERSILAIENNTIQHVELMGIFVEDADFGSNPGPPSIDDLTVRGNLVQNIDDNTVPTCTAPYGTLVVMSHETVACLDMAGNTSAQSPAACGPVAQFRLRQRDTSTFLFERLSDGDGTPGELLTSVPIIQAHAENENNPGSTAVVDLASGFTEAASGTCVKP